MPLLSVISIAKKEEDLLHLRKLLEKQTFRDFEFVISTKGTIPEAWNDAISRTRGEYLVFTESDAIPLNDKWLEDIADNVKKNTIFKGLEINPTDLNMCNLVSDASIFESVRFDTSFKCAEDTELFARLRKNGIQIEQINSFPVIHTPRQSWEKTFSRAFRIGMYFIKIIYLHGRSNIDDENTMSNNPKYVNPISNRIRLIVDNVLLLIGLLIGGLYYIPILIKKKLE